MNSKKLLFTTLSLLSIIGYGVFVFAAPPGTGGYNPGETLDPECSPGDLLPNPCIVKSPLMTADNGLTAIGNTVELGGVLNHSTTIDGDVYTHGITFDQMRDFTVDGSVIFSVGNFQTVNIGAVQTSITGEGSLAIITPQILGGTANNGQFLVLQDNTTGQVEYQDVSDFVWSISGNTGTTAGTNFIGTTDAQDFVIKTNGIEMARFYEGTGTSINSIAFGGGVAPSSNMFVYGIGSGTDATNAYDSLFFGKQSGDSATNAYQSNFFGKQSGVNAPNAHNSNFLGALAGYESYNANNSNFLGTNAGRNADNAKEANFIGDGAGYFAFNAHNSLFIGKLAGHQASYSSHSIFLGDGAGSWSDTIYGSTKASNSIFIGQGSGAQSFDLTLDNTTNPDDFSILLGNNTSTGGFSNSIALGANATNTTSNQFMIGSTNRPINQTRFQGSVIGTQCTITTGTGIACTSDERLKENIVDLDNTILGKLSNIRTVNYNLRGDTSNRYQVGFLAQNLEQYFPELVDTNSDGYKSVYYAQMTPILTKAIQELNLKITDIDNMDTPNTWRDSLIAWFGNVENGITELYVKTFHADRGEFASEICLGQQGNQTCVTKDQLDQLLLNSGTTIAPNSNVIIIDDNSNPAINPVIDESSDNNQETPVDGSNSESGLGNTEVTD